jgi:hypothetical protein
MAVLGGHGTCMSLKTCATTRQCRASSIRSIIMSIFVATESRLQENDYFNILSERFFLFLSHKRNPGRVGGWVRGWVTKQTRCVTSETSAEKNNIVKNVKFYYFEKRIKPGKTDK